MIRHFTARLIRTHVLGVLCFLACLALANWQWERAQVYVPNAGSVEKTFSELSPLRDYLPISSVGVSTQVSGTWQPSERIVLPNRISNGPDMVAPTLAQEDPAEFIGPVGTWVVDIMELADGSSLGVVRGFTENAQLVPLATGEQTITGVMQPSEDVPGLQLVNGISLLTTNLIVENSRTIAHDGYLVATSNSPGLAPVQPIFEKPPVQGLNWRNVAYTFNWIFFAVIVGFMWVRVAKDELQYAELAGITGDLSHD
jgi:cytochrome oxidase assembly protein ShyY1